MIHAHPSLSPPQSMRVYMYMYAQGAWEDTDGDTNDDTNTNAEPGENEMSSNEWRRAGAAGGH